MTDYTLTVWKADKRTKSGKVKVMDYAFPDRTENDMECIAKGVTLAKGAMMGTKAGTEYSVTYHPTTRTVTNLMTGKPVEIPYDTPHCCDPSTETYWSM